MQPMRGVTILPQHHQVTGRKIEAVAPALAIGKFSTIFFGPIFSLGHLARTRKKEPLDLSQQFPDLSLLKTVWP